MSNITPCIRCGKDRIVSKTWTQRVGESVATYTLTVCPDPQCQKKVEAELKRRDDKIALIHAKSLERRQAAIHHKKS